MGIAGQVGEHGLGTREWALGIDEPALSPERSQEGSEPLGIGQMRMAPKNRRLPAAWSAKRNSFEMNASGEPNRIITME
jgi:hypothetical protein